VLNKIDLLANDDRAAARDALLKSLGWTGPVYLVSAATREGTEALARAIMRELERDPEPV